ncbi:MAG: hypothetical protein V4726_23335 [Verrucomicrobiota bacterium]
MDEHPGDTLGKRFLTFWGALGTIAAVALLVGGYRLLFLPSNNAATDGGAGNARWNTLLNTQHAQNDDYAKVAEVEAGKTVRLPADAVLPYAVKVLSAQKPAASAILTPEGTAKAATQSHDPNLSEFEKTPGK